MNSRIKSLWRKLVNRETVSYLICGVLTTVINYAINYFYYYHAGIGTFWSNIIAWVGAVIFAFFVNKIFVFQSRDWSGHKLFYELYTFMLARLLSLVFEQVFMVITVDYIHIENWIAKLFANVFVVIMNYFASKFLIFSKKENKSHV